MSGPGLEKRASPDPSDREMIHEQARALARSDELHAAFQLLRESGFYDEDEPYARDLAKLIADQEAPYQAALGAAELTRIADPGPVIRARYRQAPSFENLAALAHFEALEALEVLAPWRPVDLAFEYLTRLTGLRSLRLSGVELPESATRLGALEKLRAVMLDGSWILTDTLRAIARLPELREIDISGAYRPGSQRRLVSEARGLERLVVSGTGFDGEDLFAIAELKRLRALELRETRLDDDDLEWIERLPSLRSLDLSQISFKGYGFRHLAALPELEALSLSGFVPGSGALARLQAAPALTTLVLAGAPVSARDLEELAALPELRDLTLPRSLDSAATSSAFSGRLRLRFAD